MSHRVLSTRLLTHQSSITLGWLVVETGPTSADTDSFNIWQGTVFDRLREFISDVACRKVATTHNTFDPMPILDFGPRCDLATPL